MRRLDLTRIFVYHDSNPGDYGSHTLNNARLDVIAYLANGQLPSHVVNDTATNGHVLARNVVALTPAEAAELCSSHGITTRIVATEPRPAGWTGIELTVDKDVVTRADWV